MSVYIGIETLAAIIAWLEVPSIVSAQRVCVHRRQYQTHFKNVNCVFNIIMGTHSMVIIANHFSVYVIQPLYCMYIRI